jgi:threonine dehydrogenase-like Zn-dependent dehydrogenase
MKAIQLIVSIPRYLLTKAVGAVYPPVFWGPLAMLRYREVPEPALPGPQWVKIKTGYGGICGSDMHTIFLKDSLALMAFVYTPVTLGHENVGIIAEVGDQVEGFAPGDRVVADPLLPCTTRGFEELCEFCQQDEFSLCQNFAEGDLAPGLSIGACHDTGGS